MLYYLGGILSESFGPARLLQSYAVLIIAALYVGFAVVQHFLPKCYNHLPHDRGREFTATAALAKGKPTGSGVFFITVFILICILICPMSAYQFEFLALTWLMMLTGFLDDKSVSSWGEYRKALLDLILCLAASILLMIYAKSSNPDGKIYMWFPFISKQISVLPWIYIAVSTILLWASVNTTNCTDGVDGLSSTLVLVALISMGTIFYFIIGHKDIAAYLLVPHIANGASWAIMTFALAGSLMGYLWHNAYPSKVLMGDAGSRALGFFIGICVMVSGNPFLIFATSSIIFVDGGLGLLKVALKRFLKINFFPNVRFPLHDHVRVNRNWSATQVLLKFLILQLLITVSILGVILKVR